MVLRKLVATLLGDKSVGRAEYFLRPQARHSWGGPFNGQRFRQRIFFEIMHRCRISVIIETGTYRGTTTALFALLNVPVYSAEAHPRFFAYSALRFRSVRDQVRIIHDDGRAFLADLARNRNVLTKRALFYLDAHWKDDLPLREELECIFSHWPDAVVMIDDFQVPGTEYAFDDYGDGKALTLEYILPLVRKHGLHVLFPSVGPTEETGAKRGCVVLHREAMSTDGSQTSTLVRHVDRNLIPHPS